MVRYELDTTGINSSNLIVDEYHDLSTRDLRAVAPKQGAYFTSSLIVYDDVSNTPLKRNQDYVCTEIVKEATLKYGQEICCVVLITNKSVSARIRITYQCLGGPYTNSVDEVISLYETAMSDNRPVTWSNVLNKPYGFNPTLHSHILADVTGFEVLVDAIDRVGRAIVLGNVPAFEYLIEYLENAISTFEDRLRSIIDNELDTKIQAAITHIESIFNNFKDTIDLINKHIASRENPHEVTKEQIGLGYLENLELATDEEVENEISVDKYITLRQLIDYVNSTSGQVNIVAHRDYILRDGVLNIELNTFGIEDGTVLYWSIVHDTTNDACFLHRQGTCAIYNNKGTFTIQATLENLGYQGSFGVKITRKSVNGKTCAQKTGLSYMTEIDDKYIDTVISPALLQDPVDPESYYTSVALHDYDDTCIVVTEQRKRLNLIRNAKLDSTVIGYMHSGDIDAEELYYALSVDRYMGTIQLR